MTTTIKPHRGTTSNDETRRVAYANLRRKKVIPVLDYMRARNWVGDHPTPGEIARKLEMSISDVGSILESLATVALAKVSGSRRCLATGKFAETWEQA